jgi:hypothetical protein
VGLESSIDEVGLLDGHGLLAVNLVGISAEQLLENLTSNVDTNSESAKQLAQFLPNTHSKMLRVL